MYAVKNWFLEKNNMRGLREKELVLVKETEKAVLLKIKGSTLEQWIPKSCLCNEWEKDTSNFGYHDYLVNVYHEEYGKGNMGERRTFKSGKNVYRGDSFIHQLSTKELTADLKKYDIIFMNRKEWNDR